MTAITRNPLGLQVCDLIAALQAQPLDDYTDIASVERKAGVVLGAVALVSTHGERIEELDAERKNAERRTGSALSALQLATSQHASLLKRADAARIILRRIKLRKQERPLPLP